MKTTSYHLNLLKDSEKVSSSPIRLRVMMPIITLLACAGMIVWWGVLFSRAMMAKVSADSAAEEITAKTSAHSEVIERMALIKEMRLELEQLGYYSNAVVHVAEPLAKFAEVMPIRVQLTNLSIPAPLPQVLKSPNPKIVLWGPVENCETQKLVIAGRAVKEVQFQQMIESLDAPEFERLVTREKDVKSFGLADDSATDGKRLLAFDVEYTMPARRFAK